MNIRRAVEAGHALRLAGHLPFIPHLCHLWDLMVPQPDHYWLAMMREWIRQMDLVVRLPGPSPGADAEVKEAERLHVPVTDLRTVLQPCPRCGGGGRMWAKDEWYPCDGPGPHWRAPHDAAPLPTGG